MAWVRTQFCKLQNGCTQFVVASDKVGGGDSVQIWLKGISKRVQMMFLEFMQTGNKLTLHLKIMQLNWWNMILHYLSY